MVGGHDDRDGGGDDGDGDGGGGDSDNRQNLSCKHSERPS